MSDNNERFYLKDNWLVTGSKGYCKVFNKTPIMDIFDRLPRNTDEVFTFKSVINCNVKKDLPEILESGNIQIIVEDVEKMDDHLKNYLERRYTGININKGVININISDKDLSEQAKSKLTSEEYDYLVKSILEGNV